MIIGHYAMRLYCDGPHPVADHNLFPHKFSSSTDTNCLRQARLMGWKIRPSKNRAICPACSLKGVKC